MRKEGVLGCMYGLAERASAEGRNRDPGGVIEHGYYGDEKRNIDQVVETAILNYLEDECGGYEFNVALKPEDASWGEDVWLTPSGQVFRGDELTDASIDYAVIVDPVEGTKNFDNRDRYTSAAALDPKNRQLEV